MSPYGIAKPLLFLLEPERAHHTSMNLIAVAHRLGIDRLYAPTVEIRPRGVMGLRFKNPVGLAAGLDKNGDYIDALAALGFGFLELGTVTPRPQPGNPRPRMFRLPAARAIINRMGFNNDGIDVLVQNIQRSEFHQQGGILGVNIGKNADTPIERAVEDYLYCLERAYAHSSYVTINISSPNTKNLRQLQGAGELDSLLSALKERRNRLADQHHKIVPIALKIAPDLDSTQITTIADSVMRHGIDAVVATNTTLARDAVAGQAHASEAGGLSGAPVFAQSNRVIVAMVRALAGAVPVIGVGGICSGADAKAKFEAGASLVQLFTGLIYRGPELVAECVAAAGNGSTEVLSV